MGHWWIWQKNAECRYQNLLRAAEQERLASRCGGSLLLFRVLLSHDGGWRREPEQS